MPWRDREKYNAWMRVNRWRYRERINEWKVESRQRLRDYGRIYTRKLRRQLREELLSALGSCCERCGIDDERVLQVHHADGNGAQHRRDTGSNPTTRGASVKYYKELLLAATKNRESVVLLCANCHLIAHWVRYVDEPLPVANADGPRRYRRAEDHPQSKLTWEKVREIRARSHGGESYRVLAKAFGLNHNFVGKVVREQVWA